MNIVNKYIWMEFVGAHLCCLSQAHLRAKSNVTRSRRAGRGRLEDTEPWKRIRKEFLPPSGPRDDMRTGQNHRKSMLLFPLVGSDVQSPVS